jgi:hypothetical protein
MWQVTQDPACKTAVNWVAKTIRWMACKEALQQQESQVLEQQHNCWLRHYKRTAIHTLQPRTTASRVHFCSWFLKSAVESQNNLQWMFFSDEV